MYPSLSSLGEAWRLQDSALGLCLLGSHCPCEAPRQGAAGVKPARPPQGTMRGKVPAAAPTPGLICQQPCVHQLTPWALWPQAAQGGQRIDRDRGARAPSSASHLLSRGHPEIRVQGPILRNKCDLPSDLAPTPPDLAPNPGPPSPASRQLQALPGLPKCGCC